MISAGSTVLQSIFLHAFFFPSDIFSSMLFFFGLIFFFMLERSVYIFMLEEFLVANLASFPFLVFLSGPL